jgi:hypothetical protein
MTMLRPFIIRCEHPKGHKAMSDLGQFVSWGEIRIYAEDYQDALERLAGMFNLSVHECCKDADRWEMCPDCTADYASRIMDGAWDEACQ